MSTQTAETYTLVVVRVPVASRETAAARLAEAFNVDPEVALQIVKSAPIRFLTDVTKAELQAIRPRLHEVSRAGLEFKITLEPNPKIPKVNWPVRPKLTEGASSVQLQPVLDALRGADVEEETLDTGKHIVRCKCCQRVFIYRKLGKRRARAAARPVVARPLSRKSASRVEAALAGDAPAPAPPLEPGLEPPGGAVPAAAGDVAEERPAAAVPTPAEAKEAPAPAGAPEAVAEPGSKPVIPDEEKAPAPATVEEKAEAKVAKQAEAEAPAAEKGKAEAPVAGATSEVAAAPIEPDIELEPEREDETAAEAVGPSIAAGSVPEPAKPTPVPVAPPPPAGISAALPEQAPVKPPEKPAEKPAAAQFAASPLSLLKPKEVVLKLKGAPEPIAPQGAGPQVIHGLPQLYPQQPEAPAPAPSPAPPPAGPPHAGIPRPAARLVSPTVRLSAEEIARAAKSSSRVPTITTRLPQSGAAPAVPAAPAAPTPVAPAAPARRPMPTVPAAVRISTGTTGRFPVPPAVRAASSGGGSLPPIFAPVAPDSSALPPATAPPDAPARRPMPTVPAAVRISTGTTGRFPIPSAVRPPSAGLGVPPATPPVQRPVPVAFPAVVAPPPVKAAPPAPVPPAPPAAVIPASVKSAPPDSSSRLPVPPASAPKSPAAETADRLVEVPSGLPQAADEAQERPAGHESFNVFLSQISSEEKRAQAVKLICEVRKCSEEEARELTTRSMIPVLKDVSKSEAERVLHRFRMIKVAGRMTLARKS